MGRQSRVFDEMTCTGEFETSVVVVIGWLISVVDCWMVGLGVGMRSWGFGVSDMQIARPSPLKQFMSVGVTNPYVSKWSSSVPYRTGHMSMGRQLRPEFLRAK